MARTRGAGPSGLPTLRRSGAVTELLFLYECQTLDPTQLRPVAERLGLTVQAASHTYRQLAQGGLLEVRDGHYRPTVRGIDHLHAALDELREDVAARLARLHVIRSTRAVAAERLRPGEAVSLELSGGILTARRGSAGPSRGRTATAGASGELVEVVGLEGIVPIEPATVTVVPLAPSDRADPSLRRRLRQLVRASGSALVAAEGLEAYHALRSAGARPVLRFAVAESSRAASKVGVPSVVVVAQEALPHLLAAFSGPDPPPLQVRALPTRRSGRGRPR